MGHELIAAISGPSPIQTARDRMRGFRRALAEARIQLPSKYVTEAPFNSEGRFAAATRLLLLTPQPMAIFAANDTLAIGALVAIRGLKLRCPEDVSLEGFDDLEFSVLTEPALTTVFQPGNHIGALACQPLLDRVRGATHPAERKILNTELRIKNSVRCVLPVRKRGRKVQDA